MAQKTTCWQLLDCTETECPAFGSKEVKCWLISGTRCQGQVQEASVDKVDMCLNCEVLKANMDALSWEETLRLMDERFKAVRRMLEERDKQLEGISMELAIGLSEVFDALHRISSGDTQIKLPEDSELELVAKLKGTVNQTAVNLSEIIDFSHEIAIGLAEHFDVLDKVTKGDLTARVSGGSKVELIEALKRMANQMIESVSGEIANRKQAEKALRKAHDELEMRVQERTAELKAANELLQEEIDERRRVATALQKSETRYHSVVEDQSELICRFTPDGELTFVNNAYCRYFEKKAEELLGLKFVPYVLDETYFDKQRNLAWPDPRNRVETREHQIVGPDGQPRWQQWSIRTVCDETGETVEFQAVGRDITNQKRAEERLLIYHKRLRSLASTLSLAEQQERRRIATEVHDHIGQNLAFTKIKLGTLRASSSVDEMKQEMDIIVKLVDEAIRDTRSLVSELGSPILYELGFVPAVEWLTQQTRRRHGIAIEFDDDGKPKPLGDDVRVLLFQAVRELLANVVRHSQAKTAKVSITRNSDQIRVDVKDDGIGFDPAEVGPALDEGGRFGLFSIRERLEPLGGRLEMVSTMGQGTEVTLTGPLGPEEQKDTMKNG